MSNATQALIPKARGMYAKRLNTAEYAEMMRRRSVPEVAAILRRHPYFERSLATLAGDPHRGQIEELLSKDIFHKYEELIHYDFEHDSFADFYIDECELDTLLRRLYLFSIGVSAVQASGLPQHLVGHTHADLFAFGTATTPKQALEVMKKGHSPFCRVLAEHLGKDPKIRDFPLLEAEMWTEYYRRLFERIETSFEGREQKLVSTLFLQQVESYNVQLILRVKTYFSAAFDEAGLRKLMLPFRFRIARYQMDALVRAQSPEAFIQYYRQIPFVPSLISQKPEEFAVAGDQVVYQLARRMLRMSSSPFAVLAAFLALAKLQKDNVVNIVEGVRYGMKPEEIASLLAR